MTDLLIRGGRVLDPANAVDESLDILIRDGRIADLSRSHRADVPLLDATGLLVTPGFVDLHTHLREPGEEHKETIETGTAAAARGGFTTLCAMPNTQPAIDTSSAVAQILERARGAAARVLPIGAITKGRAGQVLADLDELRAAGVVAFSDDGACLTDAAVARRAFEYAADLGLPIAEHCEDAELANGGTMNEGAVATRLGLRGQPSLAEVTVVERDLRLAALTGAQLHLCHLSTRESCTAVAAAKARGLAVTAEVTPHHLFLTDSAVASPIGDPAALMSYDTNAKVNPPLRSADDVEACLAAITDGAIDAIATDHAPHAIPDKSCEFDVAAFGISGLETAFGVLATLAATGRLPLKVAIERLTIGPVKAWGLDRGLLKGLGTLSVGAPADLTIVDLTSRWTVDPAHFVSKGKNTPLAGVDFTGRVVATVFGGQLVHEERH